MNQALLIFLAIYLSTPLFAETVSDIAITESMPKREITYLDALILGLVEGVTEYLPVSSTGHLLIANDLLGLNTNTTLTDNTGQLIMRDDYQPLTLKNVADAYAIIIQFGAIMAVVLLYWGRLIDMLWGVIGKSRTGLLLTRNLFTAFLPAAFLGLLLDDWIEEKLFSPIYVVIALIAGALLMLAVEARRKRRPAAMEAASPDLHELTMKQSLTVGLLQCVAMWPGTSRSMMTIVGGYVIGLTPKRAAEFSFLLGLITLTAASGYKALTMGPVMLKALSPGPALFGIVIAWASAMFAVKWLVSYLSKHGLGIFAWYRFVLAAAVLAYLYT